MNTKSINIKNHSQSLKDIGTFSNKNYGSLNVKIENLHLKKINELIRKNVFKQNDAYISAETLWELMQPIGKKAHHHFHGLTSENILATLNSLSEPYCVLQTGINRFSILSTFEENRKRLITIIEIDATLAGFPFAKINKIITIYPKDRINNYIRGKTILYIKP